MAKSLPTHSTPIPLIDLKAQFAAIEGEVRAALDSVLASQGFILGPEVAALEEEIAAYCDVGHGIGVSSGTDALLASLMALHIGPGDEVITTAFTFFATAGVIARLGARPVFVDINPGTYNMDPDGMAAAVTPRTRAVIPVHMFGRCCDMEAINDLAHRHGFPVVEDAAQAIGAEVGGRRAGALGRMGCFSFFPSKNLGAFGDGGMVVTDDAELAEKLRILRVQGAKPKFHHAVIGGNFRLDALQAAVLRVKLRHLDGWTEARQANAARYNARFADLGLAPDRLITPSMPEGRHVFHQYVIRTPRRDDLMAFLKDRGIGCGVYYPSPLHVQECFAHLAQGPGSLPEAETAARETLALPAYAEMGEERLERVVASVAEFFA